MADDPASALEPIRRRLRAFGATFADESALLGALGAVLELHRPELVDYRDGDGIERSSRDCAECEPPGTPDSWPCNTYRAITREITGAQLGEDGNHG